MVRGIYCTQSQAPVKCEKLSIKLPDSHAKILKNYRRLRSDSQHGGHRRVYQSGLSVAGYSIFLCLDDAVVYWRFNRSVWRAHLC